MFIVPKFNIRTVEVFRDMPTSCIGISVQTLTMIAFFVCMKEQSRMMPIDCNIYDDQLIFLWWKRRRKKLTIMIVCHDFLSFYCFSSSCPNSLSNFENYFSLLHAQICIDGRSHAMLSNISNRQRLVIGWFRPNLLVTFFSSVGKQRKDKKVQFRSFFGI